MPSLDITDNAGKMDPIYVCIIGGGVEGKVDDLYRNIKLKNILPFFGAEPFVFQFVIQKFKDQDI